MSAPSKYRAVRTNGYASKREARRAGELELLQRIGEIADLKMQVPYVLFASAGPYKKPMVYVADFVYFEKSAGGVFLGVAVVEDSKGFRTKEYKIKKRLMFHIHGIEIRES